MPIPSRLFDVTMMRSEGKEREKNRPRRQDRNFDQKTKNEKKKT